MPLTEQDARRLLATEDQEHLLRFWDKLDRDGQDRLLEQISSIDFELMNRLIQRWVFNEPPPETFQRIEPIPTLPVANLNDPQSRQVYEAGESALRAGRVGLLLVAGGQGTRLGYDGPKGAYPIGPVSGKSLFAFHAEKIHNLQRRYDCTLPWFIMVSHANEAATRVYFEENGYFGLHADDVRFFTQRMVPCVDEQGKFLLEAPDSIAMNPNGHGGSIPATVDNDISEECRRRGIDTLSYFQVDNWAVKVADPCFIGHHVMGNGQMSSKVHRKNEIREAVGVHCLCDGEYRVIEYSALDLYPQLLETQEDGSPKYYAGNPAIHILDVGFIEEVCRNYEQFPWWRAHKKIPHLDEAGNLVTPAAPNGYKFETFVFDALRFTTHAPIALEIVREGEYTPIKQFEGANSVRAAWASMGRYWAEWLEGAGISVPRDADGAPAVAIEISPAFALTKEEFLEKAAGRNWHFDEAIAIDAQGEVLRPAAQPA